MSFGDIRLRLVIRRHTVPDVKLVWPCAPSDDLTIAKLLGQVNEVVPLEGGEWGLEDYVLELGDGSNSASFECLHFQLVSRILKDEDQVLIRPLLNDDLKRRRRSGRHQISNGGKHLVDGIAFGRPWLHLPGDRPALELPPRKRARIAYDDDDDEDDSDAGSEFYADFDSNDELEDDGDEEHASGSSIEEDEDAHCDEEDLMQELQLLKQDRRDISEESSVNDDVGFGLLPMLDSMAALRMAFPSIPSFIIQQELRRQNQNVNDAYKALAQSYGPTLSFDEMMDSVLTASRPPNTPVAARLQSLGQESPAKPQAGRRLIEVVESVDDETQDDADVNESATLVGLGIRDAAGDSEHAIETGDTSDSDSESDSESDSGSDTDESMPERRNAWRWAPRSREYYHVSESDSDSDGDSSDPSSSGSESESNSESESESESESQSESEASSRAVAAATRNRKNKSKRHSSDSDSSSSDGDSDAAPIEIHTTRKPKPVPSIVAAPSNLVPPVVVPAVLPGNGLSRTQKRNARRKRHRQALASANASLTLDEATPDDIMADLAARKAALLSSLAASESSPDANGDSEAPDLAKIIADAANGTQELPTNELTNGTIELPTNEVSVNGLSTNRLSTNATPANGPSTNGPASGEAATPSPRRLNLNTSASKRMLFGALGLKAPKTKDDEEKLKKDLMKGVKPLTNKRLVQEVEQPPQADTTMLDDAWRDKIIYRAVECCHDGIVLSEPPFPFVQRWDPQQQYSTRKRKRQSQTHYEDYEDDSLVYDDTPAETDSRKKAKAQKNKSGEVSKDAPSTNGHARDPVDLPPLPSDLTSLVALEQKNVIPGQLITWKQLSMSKATNWQPQMASFTGVILPDSDAKNINVLLARRDREVNDHAYDEHTGQRIYEKFEAPTLDDEETAEEDDGHRTVNWHEMMEPRLIPGSAPEGFDIANGAEVTVTEVSAEKNGNTSPGQPETQQSRDEAHASADGSADSALMHSAQRPHHFELPLADDGVMSAATDSLDTGPLQEGRQQLEAAADTVANTGPSLEKPSLGDGGASAGTKRNGEIEKLAEAKKTGEMRKSTTKPSATPKSSTTTKTGQTTKMGETKKTKDGSTTAEILPKETVVPSSMAEDSEDSAQDDDAAMEIGDSMDGQQDGVIPETLLDAGAAAASPMLDSGRMPSSSPFESLEELFLSASSRPAAEALTNSLPFPTAMSLSGNGDAEYEAAMRQLDNDGEEDDGSQNLFPNATQPVAATSTTPKGTSASAPSARSSTRRQTKSKKQGTGTGSSGFVIPEGTQVISLSSSPVRTSPSAPPPDTSARKESQKRGRGRPKRDEEQTSSLEPYKLRLTRKRSASFRQSDGDEGSQIQRAKLRSRSGERQSLS